MLTAPRDPRAWIHVENERGDGTNQVRPVEGKRAVAPRRRQPVRVLEPGTEVTVEVGKGDDRSLWHTNGPDVATADGSRVLHGRLRTGEANDDEWPKARWENRRC